MKKRLLSILLIGVLSFSLCACGDPATEPTAQTEETEQQTTEEETDTQTTETEEPQETEETETAQEPENAEEVETEETTTPEETTAEETETADTTPEQTAEPEQQYTYTDMSATMYATQTVNIRTLPDTNGEKVGALSTNQEITITGQCNETNWYRFEYNGQTAYVSNSYVSDTKIEVAAAEPAANPEPEPAPEQAASNNSGSSGGSSGVKLIHEYPTGQWIDMGDWFLYVHTALDYPVSNTNDSFWTDIKAILSERYPDKRIATALGIYDRELGLSGWFVIASDVDSTGHYVFPSDCMTLINNNRYD